MGGSYGFDHPAVELGRSIDSNASRCQGPGGDVLAQCLCRLDGGHLVCLSIAEDGAPRPAHTLVASGTRAVAWRIALGRDVHVLHGVHVFNARGECAHHPKLDAHFHGAAGVEVAPQAGHALHLGGSPRGRAGYLHHVHL